MSYAEQGNSNEILVFFGMSKGAKQIEIYLLSTYNMLNIALSTIQQSYEACTLLSAFANENTGVERLNNLSKTI